MDTCSVPGRRLFGHMRCVAAYAPAGFCFTMISDHILKAYERYFTPPEAGAFVPTHIPVYLVAQTFALFPLLVVYLIHFFILAQPARRRFVWIAGGAVLGLVCWAFIGEPRLPLPSDDKPMDKKTFAYIILIVLLPGGLASWANWLIHGGAGLGLACSYYDFAKQIDPALPQSHSDDDSNKKDDEKSDKDSRMPPGATVLLSAISMCCIVATALTRLGENEIKYFEKDPSERRRFDHFMLGFVSLAGLFLYFLSVCPFVIYTKQLRWYTFCAAVSGVALWSSLRLTGSPSTWEYQWQEIMMVLFGMHVGIIVGFFTRHTAAAFGFYKAIGVEHPLVAEQRANAEKKEVLVNVQDDKQSDYEKGSSTV